MDFSIEKSYRDGNVIEVLNVSNPWIGLGLMSDGNKFTLTNSTRLVDDTNKERISIDITYDSSNTITHDKTTYQGLWVGGADRNQAQIRRNQVSRVLYYHTHTTTYVIGLLVQAIRYRSMYRVPGELNEDFGNIHLLYKVFDPITSGVITDSRVLSLTSLLRGDYKDIYPDPNRTLNSNWNKLEFGMRTYTNPDLITLHTLLTVKGDSIKLSIPDYKVSQYISRPPIGRPYYSTSYNIDYPDLLGWRVRDIYNDPETSEETIPYTDDTNPYPYIWNPSSTDSPQNSVLSGTILLGTTEGVNVIPSIALRLIDIGSDDNFRISNKRLNISRKDTNLRIQTDIDNMDVYIKERYELPVRDEGSYNVKFTILEDPTIFEVRSITHTYKIQTIDSLYVNGREVNYKYPLSSIDLTTQTTPPSGGTTGGTTGGSGEDSGTVDGPNLPSSGVSSGAPDISTSTDDELNQDNL